MLSVKAIKAKHIRRLVLLALIGILVSSICTYYEGTHGEFTQHYVALFDYMTAIAAFLIVKYVCYKHGSFSTHPRFLRFVHTVAPLTFGIYLIDPVLRKTFWYSFHCVFRPYMLEMAVSVLWYVSSMFVGGLITILYRSLKILVVKRLPGKQAKAQNETSLNRRETQVLELFRTISIDQQNHVFEMLEDLNGQRTKGQKNKPEERKQ